METFTQQIALLRARETELLRQLEIEVKIKESQLDAQQKDLYKLISELCILKKFEFYTSTPGLISSLEGQS